MHGVRYEQDEDTRISDMPAFGRDELLEREDIVDVAWYVRKLSGQEFDEAAAEPWRRHLRGQLRLLPRRAGRGHGRTRRAQPVGRDLALWRHPCRHRRPGHQARVRA
jgi:cytochrome c oxidase cbb3-type subunit 3